MQARARAVAVRQKCNGKSKRLQREGFHFSPLQLPLPWPRLPSSLALIIASPLTSLCFWPHLLQPSLKTVMPLHTLSNSSSLAQKTSWTPHQNLQGLHPAGSRYLWPSPSTWCLLVPPLHEAIFPVGPQTHGTWSCPRELACVCSSPKQSKS